MRASAYPAGTAVTTVIVTTHDKTIVDILRKRVIALERGAVVRDEVRGRYASGG